MKRKDLVIIGVIYLASLTAATVAATRKGEGADAPQKRASAESAEQVVQEQVEAYNKHDVDLFLSTYSPEIKIYDFPDKLILSGLDKMRESYGPMFDQVPEDYKAEITKRIAQGNFVIDQELLTSESAGTRESAVAIYQVEDGKIVGVWFID